MSLIQVEQKTKQVHKMSDIFLNATEKQCSTFFARISEKEKSFCVIGLLGLYSGEEYNFNKESGIGMCPDFGNIMEKFGLDHSKSIQCPECKISGAPLTILPHLNNDKDDYNHGWTFKQIGKWLKSIGY